MNKSWEESFGIDNNRFLPGEPAVWIDYLATLLPGKVERPQEEKIHDHLMYENEETRKLVEETIDKCSKDGWLLRVEDGTMYISNWDRDKYKN